MPKAIETGSTGGFKQAAFKGFGDESEEEMAIDGGKFPLERYKPISVLGEGVSGCVYLSRDRLLGKLVAVKVLRTLEREALLSFQNEARTTSKLHHPNIVKVLDFGTTANGGIPFMVMEYVPGESLESIIQEKGGLDAVPAVKIFSKITEALDYAHKARVLHRDLKPSNILVVETADSIDAHLIDFGVAKMQEHMQSATVYNGTTLVGTPAYMSPDQAQGREYDKRSDIYSLGCIMFETLTGQKPFVANSPLELISLHANAEPPSLMNFVDDETVAAMNPIVASCLEKDPRLRYQSAQALKQALQAIVSSRAETENRESTQPMEASSNRARRPRPIPLTLIALVIIASICIFFYRALSFSDEAPRMRSEEGTQNIHDEARTLIPRSRGIVIAGTTATGEGASDAEMEELADSGKLIQTLNITDSALTFHGFTTIRRLHGLSALKYINHPMGISHFAILSNIPTLNVLEIGHSKKIDFNGLNFLRDLPNFVILRIHGCEVTPRILSCIASLKHLRELELKHCTGFALVNEKPSKRKQEIRQMTTALAVVPDLTALDLSYTDVSDESLKNISKLRNLQRLGLNYTAITASGLDCLGSKKLRSLRIRGCPIDPKAIRLFVQTHRWMQVSHDARKPEEDVMNSLGE